ncbi:MAG: hypothetical protein WC476_01675 [Phycisphaerae bacterium]|jgi:hypothetical protein
MRKTLWAGQAPEDVRRLISEMGSAAAYDHIRRGLGLRNEDGYDNDALDLATIKGDWGTGTDHGRLTISIDLRQHNDQTYHWAIMATSEDGEYDEDIDHHYADTLMDCIEAICAWYDNADWDLQWVLDDTDLAAQMQAAGVLQNEKAEA